jgi:hypothetical protein
MRGVIKFWPRGSFYGVAVSEDGEFFTVHEDALPEDIQRAVRFRLLHAKIEFDVADGYHSSLLRQANNVRLVSKAKMRREQHARAAAASAEQMASPAPLRSAEGVPHDVAVAVGLIDEPKSKRTKRDRIGV